MSRVQLALNVSDLDEAVTFYSTLFGVGPAKVRPGYANFAVADPPLKLVLIEGGAPGTVNHLGIEVASTDEVTAATTALAAAGLATDVEAGTTCCYAVQDKVWVDGPDRVARVPRPARGRAVAPTGRRVPGECLPGAHRDRLRDRRPTALPRCDRPRAVAERPGDRRRIGHRHHLQRCAA